MQEIKYADAGMDLKKLGICFVRKCWLVIVAAVLGAVLGGVVYAVGHIVPESEREYQAVAKVYLDFAPDETGEVYQAYNGYTWNDLMATEPILDGTMGHLGEAYSRDEVVTATKAEILSDVRLLTITITAHDAGRCDAILEATGQSLVELGNTAKEFRKISVIQTTEAELLTADSRMKQAVLVGVVLAVVLTLLGMMFYYVLDDRIFVAKDLKQVTDVSFIGYVDAGEKLGKDYEDNLAYLRKKFGKISVLDVIQGGMAETDKVESGSLRQAEPSAKKRSVGWGEDLSEGQWQEFQSADGVVVTVRYGNVHAAYLAYIIEQLTLRECKLVGVAVCGADEKFLRRYYGHVWRA